MYVRVREKSREKERGVRERVSDIILINKLTNK